MKYVLALCIVLLPFSVSAQATSCPTITQYLTVGSRTTQVVVLKKYLAAEGLLSGVSNTNYFGPSTASALKKWQVQKGIEPTGATGPKTRTALKNCTSVIAKPHPIEVKKSIPKTCKVGGCSGQLCVDATSPDIASTCEWREEYACYKDSKCGVQADGTCGWSSATTLNQCIAKKRGSLCTPPVCPAPPDGCAYENSTWCSCGELKCKTTSSSCRFNNLTIPHGSSVEAYETETVAPGNSCVKQVRTCDMGFLEGTFRYTSCGISTVVKKPVLPKACTFNEEVVPSGTSVKAYERSSVALSETCVSETRICTEGTLSGSFTQSGCSRAQAAIIRENFKEVALGGQNIYSPDVVTQSGTRYLYFGGWLTAGQTHDAIYRAQCGNLAQNCTSISKVIDPQPYGLNHVNDPSLVTMQGGAYYIMYMTALPEGANGFVASNNSIYYSTSFTNDGVNWSTPRPLITTAWLPSATIGKTGEVELYANDTVTHGGVVRFKMGGSGITPGAPEKVIFTNGAFYLNPDVEYRPSIGLYQMFGERQGSTSIDYLTSNDGITFTLVVPDVVSSTTTGVLYIRTPGQDSETGSWLYYAGTNSQNATQNKMFFQGWSAQ